MPTLAEFYEAEQKIHRKALLIAMGLIGTLALLSFGIQGYQLYHQMKSIAEMGQILAAQNISPQPSIQKAAKLSVPVGEIADQNLFGKFEITPEVEKPVIVEQLLETNLQLVLRAAFTNTDKQKSHAVIIGMESGSNQAVNNQGSAIHYYSINDTLPGGAILHSVYTDSVILKRGDDLETLHFPGYLRKYAAPPTSTAMAHTTTTRRPTTATTLKSKPFVVTPAELKTIDALLSADNTGIRQSIQERLAKLRNR